MMSKNTKSVSLRAELLPIDKFALTPFWSFLELLPFTKSG